MTHDEIEQMLRSLASTMEHQRMINTDLRAMLANHEERMRYAEETLRQAMITQQGIKDILERLNGR